MAYEKGEEVEIKIPERMNIASIFVDEKAKGKYADKTAIYFAGELPRYPPRNYTYRKIQELVNKTGNALKSLGVQPEDRILMIVLDSIEFIATFFGAIKIGAIPIPVNTRLTGDQYQYMLHDSRAKVLVVHEEIADNIKDISQFKYLKHFIVIGKAKPGQISYYDIVNPASPQLDALEVSKDDFAFWLYSSGTTGTPKGIVHLQHDMVYCADTFFKHVVRLTEKDIVLSVSKLSFAYGLGNGMYAPFRVGASAVLFPGVPQPEKVLELIEKYQVTVLFALPMLYSRMLAIKDAEKKYNVKSLRLCLSGLEPLHPTIYHEWKQRFGVDILDVIGSTEILHVFIANREGKLKPGTTGVAVPGYELKTVDDEGKDVPVGQRGRLMVRGDSIGACYWHQHDATKKTFQGEWIDTGDLYIKDDDGFWTHAGRAGDMMRNKGLWVSPVEVESAIAAHPAVFEVAAVQSFTKEGFETVKAFIMLKDGYKPSTHLEQEIKDFLKSNGLLGYKVPELIEFTDELPKTPTGKIQRYKLRQQERQRMGFI